MKTIRITLLLLFLVGFAGACNGRIEPSFNLEYSTWHATDIVVVSEGEKIDGRVMVVETLKGNLASGDRLSIEQLAAFAGEESRTVGAPWMGRARKEPMVLSGKKMIVFLARDRERSDEEEGTSPKVVWKPASRFGGMKVSVAWIEGSATYAFTQIMNPGPSVLTDQRTSLETLKTKVKEGAQAQQVLAKIAEIPEARQRAERAARFVRSKLYFARREALRILGRSGATAVTILRKMLQDPSCGHLHASIIDTMGTAAGAKLGPEFTELVENELKFWEATAPTLEKGWWNGKGLEWSQVGPLRNRYSRVLHALYQLRRMKFAGSETAVTRFRDYWRSLPQLEDKDGLTQMSEACDAVLKELGKD